MKRFTVIGYFPSAPCEPLCFHVEASDAASAIAAGEVKALEELGEPLDPKDPFINTYVLEGHCAVLSSWAG